MSFQNESFSVDSTRYATRSSREQTWQWESISDIRRLELSTSRRWSKWAWLGLVVAAASCFFLPWLYAIGAVLVALAIAQAYGRRCWRIRVISRSRSPIEALRSFDPEETAAAFAAIHQCVHGAAPRLPGALARAVAYATARRTGFTPEQQRWLLRMRRYRSLLKASLALALTGGACWIATEAMWSLPAYSRATQTSVRQIDYSGIPAWYIKTFGPWHDWVSASRLLTLAAAVLAAASFVKIRKLRSDLNLRSTPEHPEGVPALAVAASILATPFFLFAAAVFGRFAIDTAAAALAIALLLGLLWTLLAKTVFVART